MNSPSPLISIGIPTYNRADSYLRQALESALNQTYPHIEIIVSDNCSTDNTEEIVRSYNDPRIRYFRQEKNIGPLNNSNYCLDQAGGDYFMQLHDDDMIDPDFVESCMKAADNSSEIGIIRTGTRVIDFDNNVLQDSFNTAAGLNETEFFRSWFACRISFYLCSTLYNTKRMKESGGFRSKHNLFEDVVAIAHLTRYGRADVEEIKASFRTHGNKETFSAEIRDWCEDSLYLLDVICETLPEADRKQLRDEGMKFLSFINYQFASAVKQRSRRIEAYLTIYRAYGFRHMPPPLKEALHGNSFISSLKSLRNKLKSLSVYS